MVTAFHAAQTIQSKSMVLFKSIIILRVIAIYYYCLIHVYTAVNECETSGICQNGGQCTDLESGYSCTCTNGYSGSNCEIDPPGKKN